MANRAEVLENLKQAAKQGNIREAYRDFEELPFIDQIAISVSPGVGDALAAFEVGEFSARGAKNVEDKDFLGATGNYALAGLSFASLYPLLRLFRGAKALKAIDPVVDTPALPAKIETAKVVEETVKDLPVPKVEEFKPLSLDEMTFRGTLTGPRGNFQGLTSKAAKFINTNKKLPNQTSIVTYINALKKGGVSNGELKLLNLIDEFGDVNEKLLREVNSSNPLDKITRQRLARYIKENQSAIDKGGIQKRMVSKRELEAPNRLTSRNERYLSNETEFTYHLPKDKYERGSELGRHYSGKADHEAHYVFDAAADLEMPTFVRPSSAKIIGPAEPIVDKGDKVLNLGRIQSDYSKELGKAFTKNKVNQINLIVSKPIIKETNEKLAIAINRIRDEFGQDRIGSAFFLTDNNFFKAIASAARKTSNLESPEQLQKAFIKDQQRLAKLTANGKPFQKDEYFIEPGELLNFAGESGGQSTAKSIENSINKITKTIKEFTTNDINGELNIFEPFINATKKVKASFSVSPYKDTKKLVEAKKAKDAYNKVVPKINKLSGKEIKLQKKINDSGLSLDSPSLADDIADLEKLGQSKLKLMPSNFEDITEFTLNRADLENATGKDFSQSLDKSLDEIFYELEAIKPGSPAMRQKYGPGSPEDRALKYFNEMVSNPSPTFDMGNGIKILKRASKVKTDNIPGIKMDPYAVDNKTIAYKLPIRSRFLEAVSNNYDGFSLDSAAKRLGDEGGQEREFLEKLYDQDAPREIEKMLKELGVDPKEYIGKVDAGADDLKYSGTYVKIDDDIRKLVKEKGIDAFKDGGAVEDDLPDVGSITPIGPYTKPLKPDLTFGDPVINKLKKAFNFLGDVKEFILPTPKVTDPLSLVDYVTSSSAPVVAGKTTVKGLGKIDLDAEDLEEFVEWVKSSRNKFQKERVADILKRDTKGPGKDIKNVTQNYLKENNLVDKNGNVHLYRYLNIAESNKLKPDEGLSSLTLNPEHAKMMAYKQANVTGRKLKEGEKGSLFDDMDPTSASKYEAVTMYRKPVVLEYQVPAEKIDAYLPAVFNSIDESGAGFNNLARMNVENSYSHLIDDLVDEGYDFYDATDELKGQYGLDDIYDSFDMANKESEALVDLTNIKPKNIYMDNLEIEQIANNPLIEKLEFYAGGPVSIDNMLAAL